VAVLRNVWRHNLAGRLKDHLQSILTAAYYEYMARLTGAADMIGHDHNQQRGCTIEVERFLMRDGGLPLDGTEGVVPARMPSIANVDLACGVVVPTESVTEVTQSGRTRRLARLRHRSGIEMHRVRIGSCGQSS
jgi:hypothetical protein